jgi:hypothetical protein
MQPVALDGNANVPSLCSPMKPLYQARLSDLLPADLVLVECNACRHSELLTAVMFGTAGLPPNTVIVDLERRMRCRECDARSKASISIRWAEG